MFERHDWTLFRQLSTLSQKAGVATGRLPAVVAKELADNALDVSGIKGFTAGLLRSENGFYVEDGGPGFEGDDRQIACMFSINRPLMSTKLLRLPTRGALGNGLRVVTGAVLASGGSLQVETRGRILRLLPQDDTGETIVERISESARQGTRIEVRFGESLRVSVETLAWVRQALCLASGNSSYKGKTSPHWYVSDAFYELLVAAVDRSVLELIESFDGCSHPKSRVIAGEFAGRRTRDLSRTEADVLLGRAKQYGKVVKHSRLGFVGSGLQGLPFHHLKLKGNLPTKPGRGLHVATIPFVLEAWADVAAKAAVSVSVNRTPIVSEIDAYYNPKTKAIEIIGSGLENGYKIGRKPICLHLNIDIPFMPITSDGKSPDLLPFESQIGTAIETVGRRASRNSKEPIASPSKSQKGVILECLEEAINKAGESGKYRFSLRQLFYAVRPYVITVAGEELEYNNFAKVITEYEAKRGSDIPGIYRDTRGTLYHPHEGQDIPLGTRNVETYERPAWTFNKILYCEKEGFFPILKDAGWPERHDCALMTSKGFASRAARDVLDLLGETGEDLTFYCIHDADAYGTNIYQALQGATMARASRTVHIVNLGLEPAEALAMGLQIEKVERKGGKAAPVASYVSAEWSEWLQTNRVELNAMTTPQFLEWLDRKFADAVGKVIPPVAVLARRLELDVRTTLEQAMARRILDEANLPGRVDQAVQDRRGVIDDRLSTLLDEVREELVFEPAESWCDPVHRAAVEIADQPE